MAKWLKRLAVRPTSQRNPTTSRFGSRKLQLRLYGLVSALVLTLALIAILEYVNRSLPDGSKSQYSAPLRIRGASEPNKRQVLTPRTVALSTTGTQFFIPVSTTSTISMSQCPALPLTCGCPTDVEIPSCNCSPDPAASVCACTVKIDPSCGCDPNSDPTCACPNPYIRECVCPPDSKCNRCNCPGGGSFYIPCECPLDPYAAGCGARPRVPICSGSGSSDECGCSVVQEWYCGSSATRSDCSAATSTVPGVSVSIVTIVPVFGTFSVSQAPSSPPVSPSSINLQTNSSTALGPITISPSPPFARTNSTSNPSQPVPTLAPTPPIETLITLAPSISSGSLPVDNTASIPVAVPLPSSESLATGLPFEPSITPVATLTPGPPNTLEGPTPLITSSNFVLITISSGVTTSINSDATSSNLPLVPGVVILVSSTLLPATSGPSSSSRVAAVTFLRTAPSPSESVITGSSGSVFTIPPILLATSPALTPTDSAPSSISTRPASLVGPAASLAPITSPTSPNAAESITAGSTLPASSVDPTASLAPIASPTSFNTAASITTGSTLPSSSVDSAALRVPITSPTSLNTAAFVTAGSGTPNTSNSPPTPASAQNVATSASGEGEGGGGGRGTPSPSPTHSTGSSSVTVAIYSWSVSKTVLGGYIPIILARLFHGGWMTIQNHLNQHEVVSQLGGPNGASSSVLFGPGFATWYIWPAYIAVWCISPFASELIYFDTNYGCSNPSPNNPTNPCWPPVMSVNLWVGRVLQVLLGLVAVTIVVLIALWFKKPSGSTGDPTSIAAVATLMGHPEVERDFKEFDAEMSFKQLKERLQNKKYQLSTYQTPANTERYGIVPVPLDANDGPNANLVIPRSGLPSSAATSRMKMNFNFVTNWKSFQMRSDIIFTLYLFGILGATILYVSHVNNMTAIHLFDGSTVGRRLLFAILACFGASYWARLQRDAQTLAPYADLAYPNMAPAQPTILFRKRSLAITALFSLLRYRHFIAALTALTAVLSEFLIVALSGLPYRPGQLRSEFLFCGIASLAVISFMLVMLFVVNAWRMLAVPHLPRKPDNIAAVMTYVCNSSMNKDFEGLERVNLKETEKVIGDLRKRYRYGLRRDADGKERWAADEVERAADAES